jgi:hypothetical protein
MTTRVDKLCALFADKTELCDWRAKTNTVKNNGGNKNLAAAIGVSPAVISRWNSTGKRGNFGNIPPQYNQRIVEACDANKISRSLLHDILDGQVCPCCGQALPTGQFLEARR